MAGSQSSDHGGREIARSSDRGLARRSTSLVQRSLGAIANLSQDAAIRAIEGMGGIVKLDESRRAIEVDLSETNVSDAGLEHLKGLTNLDKLVLSNTQVTDAGLKHLQGLTNLITLWLDNTKVTDAGVKKFQPSLPNCEVHL